MFNHTFRRAAAVLAFCGCALAAQKAPSPGLGQIVVASGASMGGIAVPSGGTLVSGDTLSTTASGGALVKFLTAGQAELSAATTATFTGTPAHIVARVSQGSVAISSTGPEALVAVTSECRIQAQGEEGADYSVAVSGGVGATIAAQHGDVTLIEIASGRRHVLAAGETAACPAPATGVAQAEAAKPAPGERAGQAAPAVPPSQSHTGLIVLLLGGGAAAGIGAAVAGHGGGSGTPASPSAP